MADQIKPVIQINEGKVGIDVTTPFSKLQVGDPDVQSQTMLTIASMYTATPPALNFRTGHPTAGNNTIWNMAQIRADDDGSYSGRLEFLTRAATGSGGTNEPIIRMVIDDAGNVRFNNYGAGYLKTDGSGNITAESGIPGTGTFLPLAGGTLTGALVGTTADFAGLGEFGEMITIDITDISTGENRGLKLLNSNGTDQQWNITAGQTNVDNDKFTIRDSTNNVDALTIAVNGGAATFASDVAISTSAYSQLDIITSRSGATDNIGGVQFYKSSTLKGQIFGANDGKVKIATNGNTVALTLDESQNATFAGKVAIGSAGAEFALQLSKNVDSSGLNSGVMLEMRSSTATDPSGMRFVSAPSGTTNYMQNLYDGANLKWKHWSGSAYVEKIAFSNAGAATFAGSVTTGGNILTLARAGIGTTSPQSFARVDVRSFTGAGSVGIASYGYNGAGGRAIMGQGYATDNTVAGTSTGIYGHATGARTIAGSINIGGYFTASGSVNNYAIITGGGNVGINNSTPTFGLDVVGTARVTGDTQFVTQSTTDDSTKVATTAFVKNILAEQPAGLTFLGDWNAATNSPALASGGGELANGSSTSLATDKLIDSAATFSSDGITVNTDRIRLVQANGNIEFVVITAVDSDTQLTLASNAVTATGETYIVEASPFLSPEGGYYIVSTTGATSLNGITDWTSGDWVLIATNNEFQKIDNTSILTGQGAEDKIAKWATSSGNPSVTLASSSITDTGSAVTIGNPTTITGPLTVNIDADDTVVIKSVGTNASAVFAASGDELYVGGGDSYSVRYPSSNNLAIFDNSNPGIAINTSNMNIGSAGPAGDLTSFLNIVSTTAGVNPTLNISCDNVDEASIILSEESGNQGYGARMYYQGLGNNFFNIQIGDAGTWTNRFTIDRYGDVGIGILAPQGKMTVVGATQTINMDLDANSAIGLSVMGVDSGNFNAFTIGSANSQNNAGVARFKYNGAGSSNNYMGFGFYANDDILNVKANGTVGIGLTSPTNTDYGSVIPKLHVYTAGTSGAFDLVGRFQAGNDANDTGGAILINHSNDRGLLIEGGRGGDGATPDDDAIAHLGLVTSGGTHTRVMTLKQKNQSGEVYGVGIATELPQTKLHIGPLSGGDGTAQERLRLTGDYTAAGSGALLRFTNQHNSGSNPNTGEYNLAGIIGYDYQSDWGGALGFQTAPSLGGGGNLVTRMTIDQFGNVGIGTTAPGSNKLRIIGNTAKLEGSGSGYTAWFITNSGTGNAGNYYDAINGDTAGGDYGFVGQNNSGYMSYDIGAQSPMPYHVFTGGNVGIGTTNPTNKLHVYSGNLDVSGSNAGTGNKILLTTDQNAHYIRANGYWVDVIGNQAEVFRVFGGVGGTSEYLRIDGSGDVGIGTDNPIYKLDVVSAGDGLLSLTGATKPAMIFKVGTAVVGGIQAQANTSLNVSAYGTSSLNLQTAGTTPRLTILTGGNVGIGVTNPISKLQVGEVLSSNKLTIGGYYGLGGGHLAYRSGHSNGSVWDTAIISATDDGNYNGKIEFKTTNSGGNTGAVPNTKMIIKANGNVGIGTTNPTTSKLEVTKAASGPVVKFDNTSSTGGSGLEVNGGNGTAFALSVGQYNGLERFRVQGNGNVGIGTSSPATQLEIFKINDDPATLRLSSEVQDGDAIAAIISFSNDAGGGGVQGRIENIATEDDSTIFKFYTDNTSSPSMTLFDSGNMTIAGTLTQNSDVRLKENIKPIESALDKVKQMQGVEFNKINSSTKEIGVVAQEIEKIIPELVLEDKEGIKSVAYGNITAVLIEAIKEQQKQIEELKQQLNK